MLGTDDLLRIIAICGWKCELGILGNEQWYLSLLFLFAVPLPLCTPKVVGL
jgi:hypothetical protein